MTINLVTIVIMLIGLVMYLLLNGKPSQVGLVMFACALLAFTMNGHAFSITVR